MDDKYCNILFTYIFFIIINLLYYWYLKITIYSACTMQSDTFKKIYKIAYHDHKTRLKWNMLYFASQD